ncbi:MAG: iron chelate uptake ABC transporter family permease subunit [Oscillospiraceae bacterium]
MGVSQGAGFGAAFAIIVLNMGAVGNLGSVAIPLCAFVGSMAVALVILGLSRFRQVSTQGIVLAGTAISAMFSGATTLMQYFADEIQLNTLVFWTFGSLGNTNWGDVGKMLVVLICVSACFFLRRWDYNALLSGEETAVSLGINVKRLTLSNMVLCCLLSSVIVSYIGLINFIGLIAPHIVRLVVGNNHVYLLPGSAMAGALILLLGDLFARVVISPIILPIGAITSFLGRPNVPLSPVQRRRSEMLSVENLAYHYKGRPAVLKDVNFNVNTGEFLAILGNNGVGKSTMLKCFNKILTPDGGKIILDDENLLQMSARQVAQRVAFVAQNVPSTQMTVHDMVMLGRRPYMKWGFTEDDHQIVHHAMAQLRIEPLRGRFLNELSGGERQKVMLARALAQQPKLLLLDEPTSSLDIQNQYQVLQIVRDICHEQHLTAIVVIHDLNLALRFCDRFVLLRQGGVYACGGKKSWTEMRCGMCIM